MTKQKTEPFIWETHGIHIGTGKDHIKHGIDNIEKSIQLAINKKSPSICFIIHTPRLTRFRYQKERDTDIKFVRGDAAYFQYAKQMELFKKKYEEQIKIRYGIELEWLGTELGMQWNRAKIFQAPGIDYIIGSVHFSKEGIPYDGSEKETEQLINIRGSEENFWIGYIDEMIEMVDSFQDMIHVVGHIDLPKLYTPLPKPLKEIEHSSHPLSRRMRTLLEMISDYHFALDFNTSGIRKGCGLYPDMALLKRACQLGIPIAIGTDTHYSEEIGKEYLQAIKLSQDAGYKYYISFSQGIHEKRPLLDDHDQYFKILNLGIEMLNLRFPKEKRLQTPKFSFGGSFQKLLTYFNDAIDLGEYRALRIRKEERSITLSDHAPKKPSNKIDCIYAHHTDKPGTLSILFNMLASEEINVDTAHLIPLADSTAEAYLTVTGEERSIQEAVDFVLGTASDKFIELKREKKKVLPPFRESPIYLLEIDGIDLPIPVSRQMVLSIHNNRPGVLLILLSALASHDINVVDMQLGERGDKGFAILGVEGDEKDVALVLTQLGPQFHEASHLLLNSIDSL